jgi:flavin reductase (DIM6/NTAB) family NADH-FMN oxidoreductase RutF
MEQMKMTNPTIHPAIHTQQKPSEAFAVSRLLTGPPIVLTTQADGIMGGMIATTAERASIVPSHPRVLVLVWKSNHTHLLVEKSGVFALNLLSQDQMEMVRHFGFSSGREKCKFNDVAWQKGNSGCPILRDAVAYLECRVVSSMDGGDMTVYLANVTNGARLRDGDLLNFPYFMNNLPTEWAPEYEKMMAAVVGKSSQVLDGLPSAT